MAKPTPDTLSMKERPFGLWFIVLVFAGVGVALIVQGLLMGVFVIAIPALFVLAFGGGSAIVLDRARGAATITHQRFFRPPAVTEISFAEITALTIELVPDDERDTHRAAFVLRSGKHVPFPTDGSASQKRQEQQAQRVAEFFASAIGRQLPILHESISRRVQQGSTDGIAWQLEVLSSAPHATGATRWFSAVAPLPGQFLALAQSYPNQTRAAPNGGLIALAAKLGFTATYLTRSFFEAGDLPGQSHATHVDGLDPRLSAHFAALSSDVPVGRAWLTPQAVELLVGWAERHPSGKIQVLRTDEFCGLTVLASPNGLWLAFQSQISDPAKVAEIVALGVALAQAQRGVVHNAALSAALA